MSSTIPNPVREHQSSQIFLNIHNKMKVSFNDCIVATRQHLEWEDGDEEGIQQASHKRTHFGPTEEVRGKANQKIDRALSHVPDVIHHNPKSNRTAVTLFAGNLDFKARDIDILK